MKRGHRSIREGFACPHCQATLRYRHQASVIVSQFARQWSRSLAELVPEEDFWTRRVYEPGIIGSFRTYFELLPGYVKSYLWDGVAPGEERNGVRCENLEDLTFDDETFDLVVTSDIFEHVRKPFDAFREVHRVLKPGGYHIFTVPFQWPLPEKTMARVEVSDCGGEDRDTLPRKYHSSPTDPKGSLVYTDFGTDLEDRLDALGFTTEIVPGFQYALTVSSRREAS